MIRADLLCFHAVSHDPDVLLVHHPWVADHVYEWIDSRMCSQNASTGDKWRLDRMSRTATSSSRPCVGHSRRRRRRFDFFASSRLYVLKSKHIGSPLYLVHLRIHIRIHPIHTRRVDRVTQKNKTSSKQNLVVSDRMASSCVESSSVRLNEFH